MVVVQAAWRQALQPLAPPGRLASQHLRHRPSAYSSRSSNSGSGLPRQRDYADEETDGSESSSFQAFRDFQRQAARANVQQREPQQAGGQTSSGEYRTRRSWERLSKAWYTHPKYDINTLHEEVLRRCERLMCNSGPLFMMCKLARTPEDAALVLDAFAAVRINYASKGKLQRYKDELVALFVRMCLACDACDVLVEALERSTHLGLLLSQKLVHMAMIHYGQMLDVEKVERIYAALPAGGLEPTAKTAYILVRTCVNAGALDKAEAYAVSLSQTGVRLKGSTLELLGARGAEGRAQPGAGGGAGSGRSSAAVRGVLQELDDDEAAAAAASWDEADGGAGEDVQEGDGELASASVSASTGAGPRQVLFGGGGGRAPPRGVSAGASRVAVEGFLSRCSSTSHSFFHAAGLRSCSLRHQQPRTTRVAAVASSVIIARG